MKKIAIGFIFGIATVIILVSACSFFATYSTEKTCILCMREFGITQNKYLGITLSRKTHLRNKGYSSVIGEHDHVYKSGGYGRNTGGLMACGITQEGRVFRCRKDVLEITYWLAEIHEDVESATKTLEIMDSWFPSSLTNREEVSDPMVYVYAGKFQDALLKVKTRDEWNSLVQEQARILLQ